ncbi:MAG: uroporphyrinogen decarboxylase [Actinobacteria bacterium]|nr:uroporphyrinogen decarboxylase [Actinomycetota bacterium]
MLQGPSPGPNGRQPGCCRTPSYGTVCARASPHPPRSHVADHAFLAACRGEPHERVPVWFMRQAGRSLPEYRELRERHSMFDVIHTPELAAEVTLQPVRRYDVDAAILFSDIVTPIEAVGVDVEIRSGVGPVVDQPFRTASDLDRLRPIEPDEDLAHVLQTVRMLVSELDIPLIGFAGAPFTLASYLVEGRPSKNHARTKALMYNEPALWRDLIDRIADIVTATLRAQIEAGAAAVQLFDSWAGALSARDYREHVLPASRRILTALDDLDVPRIHFGVHTGEFLDLMAGAGADVVGVDWHVPLDVARGRIGRTEIALQGNLDPTVCLGPWELVEERAREVLHRSGGHPGYVFNLGHGVLPGTDPGVLARLVDLVHDGGTVVQASS